MRQTIFNLEFRFGIEQNKVALNQVFEMLKGVMKEFERRCEEEGKIPDKYYNKAIYGSFCDNLDEIKE